MKTVDLSNWNLEIMKALLKKGRLSFQQIVNLREDVQFNRNKTREGLNWLIEKGIVREENRSQWKRGQKLWFTLTEKGRSILLEKIFGSIKENIEIVDIATSGILSEPERLEEWRETAQKTVHDIVKAEDLTLEEKIQRSMNTREAYFGAFKEALWKMHQTALNLAPSKIRRSLFGEVYLCVTKDKVVSIFLEDELLAKAPNVQIYTILG